MASSVSASSYIHAATSFDLKSWRYLFAFLSYSNRILKEMKGADGLISSTTRLRPLARRLETKSVWRDRAALGKFMQLESHRAAVGRTLEWSGPDSRTASWEASAPELSWKDCERKLADTPPIEWLSAE